MAYKLGVCNEMNRSALAFSIAISWLVPQAMAAEALPTVSDLIAKQRAYFADLSTIQYTCAETFSSGNALDGSERSLEYRKNERFMQAGEKYRYVMTIENADGVQREPQSAFGFDGRVHYRFFPDAWGAASPETMSAEAMSAHDARRLPAYIMPYAKNVFQAQDWSNHQDLNARSW